MFTLPTSTLKEVLFFLVGSFLRTKCCNLAHLTATDFDDARFKGDDVIADFFFLLIISVLQVCTVDDNACFKGAVLGVTKILLSAYLCETMVCEADNDVGRCKGTFVLVLKQANFLFHA